MVKKKEPFRKKIVTRLHKRARKIIKSIGYKLVLPLEYRWYARKPIDDGLVLFADHRDRDMPDNFLDLYEMCQKNGLKCEFMSGKPIADRVPKWQRRKAKIIYHIQFIKLFARCRVLFLVEHFPLADIVKPRPETQIVQLWHGCGILKKWGYAVTASSKDAWGMSVAARKQHIMYRNQTLATVSSSSDKVISGYQAAFDCKSCVIKPLGCPRTDLYFNGEFRQKSKEKIESIIPVIGNKKIILYAPTFRGKTIKSSGIAHNLKFVEMKERLFDEYVFITKFHPQMAKKGLSESNRLHGHDFVFDVTDLLSAEEALCAADILVTDYSSIMFEFLLFERPIISYIFDIDKYINDRGFFYPYDQLAPGPYVFTQEELVEKLLTVDEWFDIDRTRAFKEEFMSACDGHSTERIYNYVFGTEPIGKMGES